MLGACCIVKERGMNDDVDGLDFQTFPIDPPKNVWLVVKTSESIDEDALAAW